VVQVGGLAAVGEPDPKAQVVVGELTGRIDALVEHVEGAEVALLAGDVLSQPQMQRAAEPGRIGPDPAQPIARCGVRARISSTGTIPGTTSAGGSTQAGRRYSISGSGSSGGSDPDTTRC
jgi:hypothetical protein